MLPNPVFWSKLRVNRKEIMDLDNWLGEISNCKRGSINGFDRPHQPATILWFVDRCSFDNERLNLWADLKVPLNKSIQLRGGAGNCQSPLAVLARSKILEISGGEIPETGNAGVALKLFNASNPSFGLPKNIWEICRSESEKKEKVQNFLLNLLQK